MVLCLDIESGIITNAHAEVVSIDNARAAWYAGQVIDCNCSFERLAVQHCFNLEQLRKYYAEFA